MMQAVRPKRKHLALLAALVGMMVAQPLVGHRSIAGGVVSDLVLSVISLYVCVIVFGDRWQRRAALAIVLPVFASNFGVYVLPPGIHTASEVVYHCLMAAFLGFAVAVILRDIFRKSVIRGDDVIGAFCGYMLLALVWANLYTLTYLLVPGTFAVNADIAWRLGEWHRRRALFEYLSFTTLTSLGYSNMTPVGPPAYTLTWLEVMVGQFYMAVVVAQLVGLKLAQALRSSGPEAK
jgi:hypothetical protein